MWLFEKYSNGCKLDNKMDEICLTVASNGNQKTSRCLFPIFRLPLESVVEEMRADLLDLVAKW